MSNAIQIRSHKGVYAVDFGAPFTGLMDLEKKGKKHFIVDARVAELYAGPLKNALQSDSVLRIEANEPNKSLEKFPFYVSHLIDHGVRRGDTLVAIGGGVIQDIVSFIAAILLRGLDWEFYPTTLLAQADSCIGSKSSINVGHYKNQIGTFTPPRRIHIATDVLNTLEEHDFRSGVGEMIKVHIISGKEDFNWIEKNYAAVLKDKAVLLEGIRRSLEIKKKFIENDEFDQNERLVLNYGHSFGHAIESATDYAVPHGIAVTIGMDMANYISSRMGFIPKEDHEAISPLLRRNYTGFQKTNIPREAFFTALARDKKNIGKDLSLVLMRGPGKVFRDRYLLDETFRGYCEDFFSKLAL